jgi:dTDP-4-amino-4,6-dideoxygalactose transaminase
VAYNYAYYPVLFPSEAQLLAARDSLNSHDIFPRRYFYPALTELNYARPGHVPVAEDVAARVLCLPLSHDLAPDMTLSISDVISQVMAVSLPLYALQPAAATSGD